MIYDRTQIPSEEKLFIKTVLNEINTLQEKNHKHNTSLVLEFNNLNKKSKVFPINGLISSLKEDKSFLAAIGLVPMLASKFIKQAELCGPDIKWTGCEIKSLNEGTILIGMTGIIHNHRADMVSFVSTKDVTTEVNQLLISKDGERKVRTRVVSELSNKALMVKELTSSLGNKRVLYNRHSYLDVPTSSVTIAIIEKFKDTAEKEVYYEKDFGTSHAKGYDLLYDAEHVLPEDAMRYVMQGRFNSIAQAPAFIKDTKNGKEFLENRKNIKREESKVENKEKRPIYQKKASAGTLEMDKLLANARRSAMNSTKK